MHHILHCSRFQGRVLASFVAYSISACLCVAPGAAQTVSTSLWVTDAAVIAHARLGNTLYVGGSFGSVGPASGGGAPTDSATGAPIAGFPKVSGTITAAIPDGSGGWYIAGAFDAVGGVPRSGAARVLANNTVAAWNPACQGVQALALVNGRVYLAGVFTTVNGQPRSGLAAVDTVMGTPISWTATPNGAVNTLAVAAGKAYIGGTFTTINGQPRNHLAALDATTGALLAWDPNADGNVNRLIVSGVVVYVGGSFTSISGQPRNRLAAVNAGTGALSTWDPNLNGLVLSLATASGKVYAGGAFGTVGDSTRNYVAAIDSVTGIATGWKPDVDGIVQAIAVQGIPAASSRSTPLWPPTSK